MLDSFSISWIFEHNENITNRATNRFMKFYIDVESQSNPKFILKRVLGSQDHYTFFLILLLNLGQTSMSVKI